MAACCVVAAAAAVRAPRMRTPAFIHVKEAGTAGWGSRGVGGVGSMAKPAHAGPEGPDGAGISRGLQALRGCAAGTHTRARVSAPYVPPGGGVRGRRQGVRAAGRPARHHSVGILRDVAGHIRRPQRNEAPVPAGLECNVYALGQLIVDDPAPGSAYAMEIGLVPVP